jgi:hypothetical protein
MSQLLELRRTEWRTRQIRYTILRSSLRSILRYAATNFPSCTQLIAAYIKTRQCLEEFLQILPQLEEALMERHANPFANEMCSCGSGLRRLAHCEDCFLYSTSCAWCWVRSHRNTPDHWARIWDPDQCFYSKVDYSMVLPESEGVALQLGHSPGEESCSIHDPPQAMNVIHTNGVHATKIRFCCCSTVDRTVQLMRAGLFPASATYPQTAFSFAVLKQFQMHTRQSRASTFDWIISLRRFTDNVLPQNVSVSQAFI